MSNTVMLTSKEKIVTVILLIIYILSSILEYSKEYAYSEFLVHLMTPIIAISYIVFVKNKEKLFLLFFLFYAFSGIAFCLNMLHFKFDYIASINPTYAKEFYCFVNGLLIIAHVFLFVKIFNISLFRYVLKHLKMHLIVLTLLNIYLLYIVQINTTIEIAGALTYFFDIIYNAVFLFLLTISLLNYLYKDNKKSIFVFLGVLFIFFNEVFDISFIYMHKSNTTVFLSNTCLFIAFCFLYLQSKMEDTPKPKIKV